MSRTLRGTFTAAALIGFASAAHATVTISNKPTKNMTCSAGVCAPTKAKANLNVTDLTNLLASGDAKVISNSNAVDIEITDAISWASGTRLTLDSYRSIAFDAPVTVAGTAAGLTITTNDGGTGGDYTFTKKGRIGFWDLTSDLTISGVHFTLVHGVSELARAIRRNASGFYALANKVNARKLGVFSAAPISTPFAGTLEGLGNTISNLSINASGNFDSVGLFAELISGGLVRDLNLEKANVIVSQADFAGVLAGNSDHATIKNVFASGSVSATGFVSGEYGILVGANFGMIDHSATSGTIDGRNGIGGLAGGNSDGTITNSHSSASVSTAFGDAGGLVGDNYTNDGMSGISNSYATGRVTLTGSTSAGGLVGFNEAWVKSSFATGPVSGADGATVGGLVGTSELDGVENSLATGSVSGGANSKVGGLIGYDVFTAAYSYSTGTVIGGSGSDVGGVIGDLNYDGGFVGDLYWDLGTSGITDSSQGCGTPSDCQGVIGLTDVQLKSGLPSGFDPAVWGQDPNINNGYPYLLANPPPK